MAQFASLVSEYIVIFPNSQTFFYERVSLNILEILSEMFGQSSNRSQEKDEKEEEENKEEEEEEEEEQQQQQQPQQNNRTTKFIYLHSACYVQQKIIQGKEFTNQ